MKLRSCGIACFGIAGVLHLAFWIVLICLVYTTTSFSPYWVNDSAGTTTLCHPWTDLLLFPKPSRHKLYSAVVQQLDDPDCWHRLLNGAWAILGGYEDGSTL